MVTELGSHGSLRRVEPIVGNFVESVVGIRYDLEEVAGGGLACLAWASWQWETSREELGLTGL